MPLTFARLRRLAVLVLLLGSGAASCRSVPQSFGPDPARARAAADGLFGSVVTRFDRVLRDPKVLNGRRKISRNLLTPSKIFGDTTVWTATPSATTRNAVWRGVSEPSRYHFMAGASRSFLAKPGESGHDFRLRKLGGSIYEWTEDADFGVGDVTPANVAAIPTAWIASGERADANAIRADIHAAFPKSTAAWGKFFTIKRISSTRDASGAWTQRHVFTLHTKRAEATYPAFAKWLGNVVSPMRLNFRLHQGNRTWFDMVVRDDSLVVRMRSRDGKLLPLEGGSTPMPDSLSVTADLSVKFSIFRIGFKKLHGAFKVVRAPEERGWEFRFRQEPDWELPLLAEQMLNTPLKRPFVGEGSMFRIVAQRESDGPQTFLSRRIFLTVEESAILRFIAGLANRGVDSFIADGADRDLSRFMVAAFSALRDDSRAVVR